MAGLVLLLLPQLVVSVIGALIVIPIWFTMHVSIIWHCFQHWPMGTAIFTITWIAMTYQSGEPFLYAQVYRFLQPVDWNDGHREAQWPAIDWLARACIKLEGN
jgi:hypothetical protein